MSRLRSLGRELLGIDRRSLALFRIGLGLMLVSDLVKRALTLREHYTGEGVFPREAALGLQPDSPLFRVYLLSDAVWVQATLFVAAGALALCLIVGYRTRLVTLLSLVLVVSLVRRNPYATHTGDVLLQALTFWALFLPLGGHFSLDRRSGRVPPLPRQVLSMGTVAVLLQMAAFYVFAGLLKHGYDVWVRGDALWVFTNIEEYTRGFGLLLKDWPGVCKALTWFTLVLEMGGPLLLFSPWRTGPVRTAMVLVFAGFHLGIQLTVYIGIFEVLSIVGVALFLPAWFWERLLPRLAPARLVALVRHRRRFLAPVPAAPAPRPSALHRAGRQAANVVCAAALVLMLFSNWNSARDEPLALPGPLDDYGRHLALIQNWSIFSDIEGTFYGWFLVLGQRADGELVDVLEDAPFRGVERPPHFATTFVNHNQRRFWRQLALPVNEWLRPYLAEYLVRRWNATHDVPLVRVAGFHVGNAPGRGEEFQRLNRLFVFARPQPGLRDAPEAEKALFALRQQEWRRFLGSLPTRLRVSEPAAVRLVAALEERMGGRAAWERTRHLAWTFPGPRRHLWDKHTNDVRIEVPAEELVLLMNVGTRAGRAFRSGREVADPSEAAQLLDQGYRWWANDSWWVVMPWKLRDPGVAVQLRGAGALGDGRPADLVSVTFNGVGTTPRNRYVLAIARDTGLLEEWTFFRDLTDREPTFTRPWSGWERLGEVLLATDKGTGHDWRLRVADELPPGCYDDPDFAAFQALGAYAAER